MTESSWGALNTGRKIVCQVDNMDEKLHTTKTKETSNEFFHRACSKGAHITYISDGRRYPGKIKDRFCKDHNVVTCKCGWEWGKHYAM